MHKKRLPERKRIKKTAHPGTGDALNVQQRQMKFLLCFPERQLGNGLIAGLVPSRYESANALAIYAPLHRTHGMLQLKINAKGSTCVVAAIQATENKSGARKNLTNLAENANRHLGLPWPNFLLGELEKWARECGMRKMEICFPETLQYYRSPQVNEVILDEAERKALDKKIKNTLRKIAKGKPLPLKKEEVEFIREALFLATTVPRNIPGSLKENPSFIENNSAYINRKKCPDWKHRIPILLLTCFKTMKIRQRMRSMYGLAAKACGFTADHERKVFYKNLE